MLAVFDAFLPAGNGGAAVALSSVLSRIEQTEY
jgi:hypothetical protein